MPSIGSRADAFPRVRGSRTQKQGFFYSLNEIELSCAAYRAAQQ